MNKYEALHLLRAQLRAYGLNDWIAQLDNAKRRQGVCKYSKKTISLSSDFVSLNTQDEVLQVIYHEVAHALAGHAAGHGYQWLKVARGLGYKNGKYASDTSEKPAPKWIGACPKCNWKCGRHRLTEKTRRGGCPKCRPFTILQWRENWAGERVKG